MTFAVGCEKVSHENIESWVGTKKGRGKLKDALSGDHATDLRAHAAERLIVALGDWEAVQEVIESMPEADRGAVLIDLAPRLWEQARVGGAMEVPTVAQIAAKDALFHLREFGDQSVSAQIDEYLVEWYTGGHYEGRATAGSATGPLVARQLGSTIAPRLIEHAKAVLHTPPDDKGRRAQLGNETLRALALTGEQKALDLLIEVYREPQGDTSLPERAIAALHFAYVEPSGVEAADGKALVHVLSALEGIALDRGASGRVINDAIDLLAALGPDCADSFVRIIAFDHPQEAFRWMGLQKGVRCAGPQGLLALTEALPSKVNFERGYLSKYLWDELAKFPQKEVAEAALGLLESRSWVSKVTGIEVLGTLPGSSMSAKDIHKIQSLAKESKVLRNWWGEQSKVPAGQRKKDPTLGQVASEVAKRLEDVAKESGSE
jgi:hypothetical protein